jgi:PhnB protein
MTPSSKGKVKAQPENYHTMTPSLTVKGADAAIAWYTKVFDAKLLSRSPTPDGKGVWHAELKIGDSVLMLNDEDPQMGASAPKGDGASGAIHMYTENVDGVFQKAIAAGAKQQMPPMDMFWGDRYAQIIDPFGHVWGLATHTEDVPRSEMEARGKAWAEKMGSRSP